MELIDKKEFAKAALNKNLKTFVLHILLFFSLKSKISIYLAKKPR